LWLCTALFALRVAGQLIVVLARPRWLPPMAHWMSGVMPYRYLLPSQLLILSAMVAITTAVATERGPLAARSETAGWALLVAALVYWAGMLARLAVRWRKPRAQRPVAGPIPIAFHCILAAFLFIYARHHLGW
jgi:hypothetical protein